MGSKHNTILVTGGSGYIGSHCVKALLDAGRRVLVVDNLCTGYQRLTVSDDFAAVDILNTEALIAALKKYEIGAVMHFAAHAYVGESVQDPEKYYRNNVMGTLSLLTAMRQLQINQLIFSSTCAVYGNPQKLPLTEDHPLNPVNPYGMTKRVVEAMLHDFSQAYGLQYVSLRYFNAAGADPDGRLGECHNPETHLIPLVLQAASGRKSDITVFGSDYDTPDGTCIRDYIHIADIAKAHVMSLDYLETNEQSNIFNVGTEHGYSVNQIIAACEKVTGKKIKVVEGERRPGDPPVLVASAEKIRNVLGWQPDFDNLDNIIQTAWRWEQSEAGIKV